MTVNKKVSQNLIFYVTKLATISYMVKANKKQYKEKQIFMRNNMILIKTNNRI